MLCMLITILADGTRPINEYLTHFEEVARVNEWSLELKRKYLGVSLRGAAQTVLYDFNAECKTYEELVKFLRSRFQPFLRSRFQPEQEALYKVQLRNRRRLPGESLKWSLELKRKYLGVSLRGAAQTVLYDFNAECKTYEELVKFLRSRFQPDEQEALYKVQLRNRRRLPGESLNDLAQAIRQLTQNAYPKAPVEWRETVAKDQFIETLSERQLRHQVYSMFPKTLNDALATAVQLEAFYLEEVKKNKAKPVVRMVEECPNRENPVSRTS